ncbi:glycosyl hydrolase, partial [Rubripirellula tenax]|uniref:glycosyl hydrolase n=1 Tax=Rubripirellula tenax TaxID=2528015 RepID=UPI0016442C6B
MNLAQFQPTFADSIGSGSLNEATDGIVSNDSRLVTQDSTSPHWVEVRLQAPYPVGSAHVYLGLDDTNDVSSFDVQYHNGSSWQTITSVVGDNSTDHNLVFPATVTASRFRIHTSSANELQVKEFVLLPANGPAGYPLGTAVNLNLGASLAPGTTSVDGTNYAVNAVDGYVADDSRWISDSSSGVHRLALRIPNSHEVGSVHLYSGESGTGGATINTLTDFTIFYSNNFGSSYTAIPGGTVSSGTMTGNSITGNTSGELVINFSTPVLANRIRIDFNQASGAVREMVVLPANTTSTGTGYPIGTSVKFESPPATKYDDYGDAWYRIVSRENSRALIADETGATQVINGTPDVERQYQVLYSYALDAYRIRSEDTGKALQVENASLDAGAAIVEGNYSAAPHQLWRLEPTDGGFFQFVNVWSGMVLHTGGAYPNTVTQQPMDQAADPADNQEWRLAFIDDYFKKGTASATVGSFGSSWSYNWGRGNFDSLPIDQFYAPMQFRQGWPALSTLHQKYDDWNDELKPSYLLGFNEPDKEDQANMTVAAAVNLWPQLEAMDIPLVSPANAHGAAGQAWLEDFSDQTDALGYRTDYSGTHWYSSPNVNNVFNWIDSTQTKSNGRDVWLTEFAVVDWSGGSGNWSEETNYNFILEFMYRAESKANLDKYSLFLWTGAEPTTPWEKSNPRSDFFISNSGKALTPFGKAYAGWDGETEVANETLYVIHNRAASHRLQNDGGTAVEQASIRTEDDTVQWLVQDAGNDEVYLTSAVDGRRAKLEAGNIVMSEPGATGWGVRWKIQQDQFGWQNIVHVGSGNYLRLNRVNNASGAPTSMTLDVVTPATAASLGSTDWWFVKPYVEAIHSDFGDAPDGYPVTLAEDGARHTSGGPQLGPLADSEADGTHSADSSFDDTNDSDDEDGVVLPNAIYVSSSTAATASVDVELANADPTSNRLDAWIDFNRDGDWLDAGEQIFTNFNLGTTDGIQTLSFTVPQDTGTNVELGDTYARFRLSTAGNLSVTGATFDGEVEDYRVTIAAAAVPATVVNRGLAYRGASAIYGEGMVDPNKSALHGPGAAASMANYTNYSQGINR